MFPWKGLAGESGRSGSPSSVPNGFAVFLELLFSLRQSLGRGDTSVAVPLATQ